MLYRVSLALFLFCVSALPPSSSTQNVPVKADKDLTILNASVKNKAGNFVMGLLPEAFQIVDGKETPSIEFFESSDSPLSIGLVVDTSGSITYVHDKRTSTSRRVGDALLRFVELSNPGNEYFLMAFDMKPRLVTDWKSVAELTSLQIDLGPEKNYTAFYDAVFAAKEKLATGRYPRRALIVLTDGQDNQSSHTLKQLKESLKGTEVLLYGIGVVNPVDSSDLGLEGQMILEDLAEITGGEAMFPTDPTRLNEVAEMFATNLRNQYRLGFRANPANPPNQWHRIKLKVTPRAGAPKDFQTLTVRTRQGYYSK